MLGLMLGLAWGYLSRRQCGGLEKDVRDLCRHLRLSPGSAPLALSVRQVVDRLFKIYRGRNRKEARSPRPCIRQTSKAPSPVLLDFDPSKSHQAESPPVLVVNETRAESIARPARPANDSPYYFTGS